jgi:hypothetical protein
VPPTPARVPSSISSLDRGLKFAAPSAGFKRDCVQPDFLGQSLNISGLELGGLAES